MLEARQLVMLSLEQASCQSCIWGVKQNSGFKTKGNIFIDWVAPNSIYPFNSLGWPRQSFSLQFQYKSKQASDENEENIN